MKITALFILLIILASTLFCSCLGKPLYEGMDDGSDTATNTDTTSDNNVNNDYTNSVFSSGGDPGSLLETGANNYSSVSGNGNTNKTDIPEGDEDLYVLKSQIVPPVCPACPEVKACPRQEACPPCPPCARCPEPSFECKKVPNYSSNNNDSLPRPVLADFSQFGM